MLVIGIVVVLVIIAGAAYMLLPKGPPQPTPTTTTTPEPTTTQTTPSTAKTTETMATTPTTTSKTTSSVTSPTATETAATTTETVEMTSSATLPEIEYVPPSTVTDLLKVAKSMTYQWTSNKETTSYSYEVLAEESVGGVATWKTKVQFANEETEDLTVWISQVDGSVKQVEIDGSTMTGDMAKYYEGMVGFLVMPFTTVGGYTWAWHEYWRLPADVGVVTYQGSQTQSLGPTTLTVEKFRFDPNPLYEPAKDMKYVEWGFAKLDSIGIATHFKVENKNGEVFSFDLVSLTRA